MKLKEIINRIKCKLFVCCKVTCNEALEKIEEEIEEVIEDIEETLEEKFVRMLNENPDEFIEFKKKYKKRSSSV